MIRIAWLLLAAVLSGALVGKLLSWERNRLPVRELNFTERYVTIPPAQVFVIPASVPLPKPNPLRHKQPPLKLQVKF